LTRSSRDAAVLDAVIEARRLSFSSETLPPVSLPASPVDQGYGDDQDYGDG